MRVSAEAYKQLSEKRIALIGMSGVGKTRLAKKLGTDWFHYSCDYRIGTKYLCEQILDNIKRYAIQVPCIRDLLRSDSIYIASNITIDNLAVLSHFLGKIGRRDLHGLSLDQFDCRQKLHREAEISAIADVGDFIAKSKEIYGYPNFLVDTGGSLCELEDEKCIQLLAQHTIILYIEADAACRDRMIQAQTQAPKPLYYRKAFIEQFLELYMRNHHLDSPDAIEPDDFVSWIYPHLIEARQPRYEQIAREYGYTVSATEVCAVQNEQDFDDLMCTALARQDNTRP